MIVRTLLAALVAGLIAGVFMTGAQELRVVPLILHAEEFEGAEEPAADPSATQTQQHSSMSGAAVVDEVIAMLSPVTPAYAHEGEHEEGGIMFGMSRFSGTLLANLVAGAGFALLLAAISLLSNRPVTLANGVYWGACGWLAVHLLPAIGLPPELPGFPAAELQERQVWWIATILFSGAGLYLLALRGELLAKVAGIVLIALPHIYGAPQPLDISSNVPAVLGAEFAVAALATTLGFWLVLGIVLGFINDRFLKA